MNIYIDESGSINNKNTYDKFFVVCLLKVNDIPKLQRAYKRFVSSNINRLKELDKDKIDSKNGKVLKQGGKMFSDDKFRELKGSQFDRNLKLKFLSFFAQNPCFELFFIKINNERLSDKFCANTARAFNYSIKLAISFLLRKGLLPVENCNLQLDERNEKTEAKFFLENYLNTEISLGDDVDAHFAVKYFDSSNNRFVQLADVFSNIMYSNLKNGGYEEALNSLIDAGIIKYVFEFPRGCIDKKDN